MKTMLKKTMLSVFAMVIVIPLAMPMKEEQEEIQIVEKNKEKKKRSREVSTVNPEPSTQPEQKNRKQLTITGKDEKNNEYSITIEPKHINLLETYSHAQTTNFDKSLIIPFSCPEEDVTFFFKLLSKWNALNNILEKQTDIFGSNFFKENLTAQNSAFIVKLATHFAIESWIFYCANTCDKKLGLEILKQCFKINNIDPKNRELVVKTAKKMSDLRGTNPSINISEILGTTFSLAEANEIKPFDKRPECFSTNVINLDAKTLGCTLHDIQNLPKILEPFLKNKDKFTLYLSGHAITDISPLEPLKNLQLIDLNLEGNHIEDITILGKFTNLAFLNLSHNKIKNIESLANLKHLTSLDLDNNQIENITYVKDLTDLKYLYLSNNNIQDITSLEKSTKLITLCLNNNKIEKIDALKNLVNLDVLKISDNNISDIGPLIPLNKLLFLSIARNKITSIKEQSFKEKNKLEMLDLSFNEIKDISAIRNCEKLTTLKFTGNPIPANAPYNYLDESLPLLLKKNGTIFFPEKNPDDINNDLDIYKRNFFTVKTVPHIGLTKEAFDHIKQNMPEVLKNKKSITLLFQAHKQPDESIIIKNIKQNIKKCINFHKTILLRVETNNIPDKITDSNDPDLDFELKELTDIKTNKNLTKETLPANDMVWGTFEEIKKNKPNENESDNENDIVFTLKTIEDVESSMEMTKDKLPASKPVWVTYKRQEQGI